MRREIKRRSGYRKRGKGRPTKMEGGGRMKVVRKRRKGKRGREGRKGKRWKKGGRKKDRKEPKRNDGKAKRKGKTRVKKII